MYTLTRLIVLFLAALALPATAQPYPAKTIRLVVPFAPGGSADGLARPLAEKLGAALGQPMVVDNRAGALTVIGAEIVAKAPPDGYTLYLMPGTHVLIPYLMQKVPFDPIQDFTPIAMFGSQPYLVMANPQQPFATLAQMIAYAKANPGKLTMGVTDAVTRAAAESLVQLAKIDVTLVNYKGGGPLVTDIVAGHVQTGIGAPPLYMQFQKDKRVNALAVTIPTRLSFLPDVPTVAEAAGLQGYDVQTWYALAGPAKLPRDIVDRLQGEIAKALAEPDMQKKLVELAIEKPADTSAERTGLVMKSYKDHMGKLIQGAGIKPE